jgi:hypothetical protein
MEASCLSLNLRHSLGRFQEMQDGLHTDKAVDNDRVLPSGGGGSGTFTTTLSEEMGLFFRSTETQLVTRDGAIHVQVPAANMQQIQAQSGMVLRVLPTNPEWRVWRDGIQYRDYDMIPH